MKWLLYTFVVVAVIVALCGCSKEINPQENGTAITLMPVMDNGGNSTRALLYKSEVDDLRKDLFKSYTFLSNTTTLYFNSDVKYSNEDRDPSKHRWDFCTEAGAYKDYFWPVLGSLDFFAYAPSNCGYVTVNSSTNPPTFTANLPQSNTQNSIHQENMKEFMYAYTPNQDKSQEWVPLAFNHPFAAIAFKVMQSHRDLTVNSITIKDIYSTGTCSIDASSVDKPVWKLSGKNNLNLAVGKIIPGQVNFGGDLCGPYIVLPQVNSGNDDNDDNKKIIEIEFHWVGVKEPGWTEVGGKANTYKITGKISNNWVASKVYTYELDLGNSREEILFKVKVDDWEYVYEHTFEIE